MATTLNAFPRIADRVSEQGDCWVWTGALRQQEGQVRYGTMRYEGRLRQVHRLVYELLVGPIPDGLQIDHLCREPLCVNPDHLEPVTGRENTLRSPIALAAVNARKTHCVRGHVFDEANTYLIQRPGGRVSRSCRACKREAERERRHGSR